MHPNGLPFVDRIYYQSLPLFFLASILHDVAVAVKQTLKKKTLVGIWMYLLPELLNESLYEMDSDNSKNIPVSQRQTIFRESPYS